MTKIKYKIEDQETEVTLSKYKSLYVYDDNGNEIKLNTGKTMVCIVEDGDTFNLDDKSIESN